MQRCVPSYSSVRTCCGGIGRLLSMNEMLNRAGSERYACVASHVEIGAHDSEKKEYHSGAFASDSLLVACRSSFIRACTSVWPTMVLASSSSYRRHHHWYW